MPEPEANGLGARLARLPGQFALALVNATAILVIVAAVLALATLVRVEEMAGNVAATMTDAVLARVDVDPKALSADLHDLAADVRGLTAALKQAKAEGTLLPEARVERLDARLDALQTGIRQLTESRAILIDEALTGVGRSLARGLEALRSCAPEALPGEPPSA